MTLLMKCRYHTHCKKCRDRCIHFGMSGGSHERYARFLRSRHPHSLVAGLPMAALGSIWHQRSWRCCRWPMRTAECALELWDGTPQRKANAGREAVTTAATIFGLVPSNSSMSRWHPSHLLSLAAHKEFKKILFVPD